MRILTLVLCTAALSACSTPIDAPQSPTFGLAVASMQSQIISTEVSALPPESSGFRGVDAIRRYETGEARRLEAQSTSTLTVNLVPTAK